MIEKRTNNMNDDATVARQHAILLAQQKAEKDLEDAMSAEIEFDEYGDEIRGVYRISGTFCSSHSSSVPPH